MKLDECHLSLAITPKTGLKDPQGASIWEVVLMNVSNSVVQNLIISSSAQGWIDGASMQTDVNRKFVEVLKPQSFVKVEPLKNEVMQLKNTFVVSYSVEGQLFEKTFDFQKGDSTFNALEIIPVLEVEGLWIK